VIKQAETSIRIDEIFSEMGISDAHFYKWCQKHDGLGPTELRKLKQLEEENSKFKRIDADLSIDKAIQINVLSMNLGKLTQPDFVM
jgi:putative transposase